MRTIRTLLVGVGGYGNGYVEAVLDHAEELGIEPVGVVDPQPSGCRRLAELQARVPVVHPDLAAFYAAGSAELAVISAPIHLHAPFTIEALEGGSHVLCEKPVAAVVQDARAMAEAEARTGRTVSVGYQWSFSPTVRRIRDDVAAGRLGAPVSLRTVVLWPRPASYYSRSPWAGRLRLPDGSWVLDGPANNATAHYLHNSLFILGAEAGLPTEVQAELYRANPIEGYDTAAIRVKTACGAEIVFLTSHTVPSLAGPLIDYQFSEARLVEIFPGEFRARHADGSVVDYGMPDRTPLEKLRRAADDVRRGNPPACSIAEATPALLSVCGAHESSPIIPVPPELVRRTETSPGDELTWVNGMQEALMQSYALGVLPSELGDFEWMRGGEIVDLADYREFPILDPLRNA